MKNWVKNLLLIMIGVAIGVIVLFVALYGWDILPREDYKFNFDTLISAMGVVGSLGAIFIVYWSTKKQIQSQNKENNRPYIVSRGSDKTEKGYLTTSLFNIGKGIASQIVIMPLSGAKGLNHIYDYQYEKPYGVDDLSEPVFFLPSEKTNCTRFLVLYQDLYNNDYQTLVELWDNSPIDVTTRSMPQNSRGFIKGMKEEGIDFEEFYTQYLKKHFYEGN